MEEVDFAIIGAGIAGASLAWELSPHASIALLERESQPGYHTTGRSAALYMATYGTPQVRALTRASRPFYNRPPAEFGESPILTPRGVLHVAAPGQEGLLEQSWRELAKRSGDVRRVSRDEMLAMVPCLRAEASAAGIAEQGASDIDVHTLLQGYLRGARNHGCIMHTDAEVVSLRFENKAWRIELKSGEFLRARNLVNAAGAWADSVAEQAGIPGIGLQPRRRSAFIFAPPADLQVADWPAVVGIDESYYFKPDAGMLLGSPANADPVAPHDVAPEELDIALGIHQIEQATTLKIRRPHRTWAGLRSFVADGDLVIGWEQSRPGFFWLAAQGGYGIQSAAGAALLARSLLLREPLPEPLAQQEVCAEALSPNRLLRR